MPDNACVKCHEHKDRDAIGTCAFCGRGFCAACRILVEGKAACSVCGAKLYSTGQGKAGSSLDQGSIWARTTDATSRFAASALLVLCSVTYIPLLVHWDKGRPAFIALVVIAVVSFGFQAALIVRNNFWIWWGCLVLWIVDMVVANIAQLHSLDPSGAWSFIVLLCFFPFAIGIMVWISYRNQTVMFASMAITWILSMIIYVVLHNALINH